MTAVDLVAILGAFFIVGLVCYVFGFMTADKFWQQLREEEREAGYKASYEQSTGDYPGGPHR